MEIVSYADLKKEEIEVGRCRNYWLDRTTSERPGSCLRGEGLPASDGFGRLEATDKGGDTK